MYFVRSKLKRVARYMGGAGDGVKQDRKARAVVTAKIGVFNAKARAYSRNHDLCRIISALGAPLGFVRSASS
jgi:hypothetical protein